VVALGLVESSQRGEEGREGEGEEQLWIPHTVGDRQVEMAEKSLFVSIYYDHDREAAANQPFVMEVYQRFSKLFIEPPLSGTYLQHTRQLNATTDELT